MKKFLLIGLLFCSCIKQYDSLCYTNYDIYNYNVCKNPVKCIILSDMPKNYDDIIIQLYSDSGIKNEFKNYMLKDSLIKFDLSELPCNYYTDTTKLRIEIKFIILK